MLKEILITLIVVIVVPIIWIFYERLSYKATKPDQLGMIMIKPGLMSWFLCILSGLLSVLFATNTILSLVRNEDVIFWIFLGPPLSALMGFGVYVVLFTRLRASGAYIQIRSMKGWKQFEWDEIEGLFNHWIHGTRLHVVGNKPMFVWVYGYGSREVQELFGMYDKPFGP